MIMIQQLGLMTLLSLKFTSLRLHRFHWIVNFRILQKRCLSAAHCLHMVILSVILALVLLATLCCCDNNNNNKTKIWVIVLDARKHEFDVLVSRWQPLLPTVQFNRMPAVNLQIQGHGVCLSFLTVLTFDARSSKPTVIFESDARPFRKVKYDHMFDDRFNQFELYFLGGHHVLPVGDRQSGWTPVRQLWGAYAIVVAAHARQRVIDVLREYCLAKRSLYSIDDLLSECFKSAIATPLLVDHPRSAFSETFRKQKHFPWAGWRRWWIFPQKPADRQFNCQTFEVERGLNPQT
jgi:hypothetical protein